MEKFIIHLKNPRKRQFFLELLKQMDFLEWQVTSKEGENSKQEDYNFFDSAGLFENRDIDANQLRQQAWKIKR